MKMSENKIVIDFSELGGPVYIGRKRGKSVRDKFKLDDIDKGDFTVYVKIPETTYSINSSFFLGLFGKSIKHAGSREAFLKKFVFTYPSAIVQETIDIGISRALHEKALLIDD